MGCLAGMVPGMLFHEDRWLGGYTSWRRRMIRLAHIAFFGLGLINLGFALTAVSLGIRSGLTLISWLLVVGAITMPAVCYLSAWRKVFRHLFCVPAVSVTVGVGLFLWRVLQL